MDCREIRIFLVILPDGNLVHPLRHGNVGTSSSGCCAGSCQCVPWYPPCGLWSLLRHGLLSHVGLRLWLVICPVLGRLLRRHCLLLLRAGCRSLLSAGACVAIGLCACGCGGYCGACRGCWGAALPVVPAAVVAVEPVHPSVQTGCPCSSPLSVPPPSRRFFFWSCGLA